MRRLFTRFTQDREWLDLRVVNAGNRPRDAPGTHIGDFTEETQDPIYGFPAETQAHRQSLDLIIDEPELLHISEMTPTLLVDEGVDASASPIESDRISNSDGSDDGTDDNDAEQLQGFTRLDAVPASQKIYDGTDQEGRLKFSGYFLENNGGVHQSWKLLEERYLVALALTEVCCEVRQGKVLYFPMREDLPGKRSWLEPQAKCENTTIFHRLPKLLYTPLKWEDEDVTIWTEMSHQDRLALLNARAGPIRRTDPVMPVDLVWEDEEKVKSRTPEIS
ncbi:MAG: hypothetical protein Q9210_003436 [Variospora velana]